MISDIEPGSRTVLPMSFRVLETANRPQDSTTGSFESETLDRSMEEQGNNEPVDLEAVLNAAREDGARDGFLRASEEFDSRLQKERGTITSFMEQFSREKQRYFLDVESEVVRLSLAIAERILHREVSLDPLLLAGAARVALEQVAEGSEAVLHVPPAEMELWQNVFRRRTDSVAIQGDNSLDCGDCILQTRSGSVRLGVRAQLQEIEQGFFELLQRRPAAELPS